MPSPEPLKPVEVTRPPLQMLRESLRADSPLREASVSRLLLMTCALAIPFVTLLAMFQSWNLPLGINAVLLTLIVYHGTLLQLFRRGWYHPAVTWVNVLIEISIPYLILLLIALLRTPEYAHMSPVHVVWGAVVVITALRANPLLSLVAGLVAASEWLFVYGALILPKLQPDAVAALRWPAALMRAVCLVFAGGFAWMLARHYIRKSEEALSAIREQDLMGKYFLHERLGVGGMAEVYHGTYCPEGGFQKPVAIKRILPTYASNEVFVEMFREEARLCASLNHPNVVQVYDCGRFRDSFIVTMEFVDGLPLNQLLSRAPEQLAFAVIAYLGAELADALDYIHRKLDGQGQPLNLVHRDVNPPNILLSRIGEVKLADFGVANAANRVATGRTDIFYGKLRYAAPEQIIADRSIDRRADLFALGLTLNEALTGRPVYGKEADVSLEQGIFPRIPRPGELRPETPRALDELVASLCEFDPTRRPQSGAEVRRRLTALEGPLAPYPFGQQALAKLVERAVGNTSRVRAGKPQARERLTEIPPLIAPSPNRLKDRARKKKRASEPKPPESRSGSGRDRRRQTASELPVKAPASAAHAPKPVVEGATVPMSTADLPPWARPPAADGSSLESTLEPEPTLDASEETDEEATKQARGRQARGKR